MDAHPTNPAASDARPFDLLATLRRATEMGIDPARVLLALGLATPPPDATPGA